MEHGKKNPSLTVLITRARMSPENTKISAQFSAECVLSQLMQESGHGPHLTSPKLALHQAQCLVSYLTFFLKQITILLVITTAACSQKLD